MLNPKTEDSHPAGIAMRRQTYEATLASIGKQQHGFQHPMELADITEAGTESTIADAMTVTVGKPPAAAPGQRIQFEASRRAGDPQAPLTYIRKVRPAPDVTLNIPATPLKQTADVLANVTGDIRKTIIHLYRRPGVSKQQIARQTGWSEHTIRAALQAEPNRCLQCKQPSPPDRLRCPECRQRATAAHRQGRASQTAASKL